MSLKDQPTALDEKAPSQDSQQSIHKEDVEQSEQQDQEAVVRDWSEKEEKKLVYVALADNLSCRTQF